MRHKSLETERAYVGRAKCIIEHCGTPDMANVGEGEIKTFLTDLAVERNVTAGTQKQAKCELLFSFQPGVGREPGFLDVGRATKLGMLAGGREPAGTRETIAGILGACGSCSVQGMFGRP